MDSAFANLSVALGHADTVYEVGGAKMMSRGDLKIKDNKTFSIDYYTPTTQATRNRIVADGTKRYEFFGEKWTEKPLGKPRKDAALTDAEIKDWPQNFYQQMFKSYSDDANFWKPLLEGLGRGAGGYTTSLEQKTDKVHDKDRTIYRVIATRKSDGAEFQISVDGVRYLPLTVKSVIKNAKGGEDKRFWTCEWFFSGTFSDKDFIVPNLHPEVREPVH
jgi:hypothetical protein